MDMRAHNLNKRKRRIFGEETDRFHTTKCGDNLCPFLFGIDRACGSFQATYRRITIDSDE
jgi:hypothetical protein